MPGALGRDAEVVPSCEAEDCLHVLTTGREDDGHGSLIGDEVPRLAGGVPAFVLREDDLAENGGAKSEQILLGAVRVQHVVPP